MHSLSGGRKIAAQADIPFFGHGCLQVTDAVEKLKQCVKFSPRSELAMSAVGIHPRAIRTIADIL
jgi:hypothetical protein